MSRYKEGDKFEDVKVTLKITDIDSDDWVTFECDELDCTSVISFDDFDALVNPVTRLARLKQLQAKVNKEVKELEGNNLVNKGE